MPRTKKGSLPSYRPHKATGQAIVTVPLATGGRKDIYLGPHGSPASKKEYQRVLDVLNDNGGVYPVDTVYVQPTDLTINEMILSWWKAAESRYGDESLELDNYRTALRHLRELYGTHPAARFTPKCLKAVRQRMVDALQHRVRPTDKTDAPGLWLGEDRFRPQQQEAQLAKKGPWVKVEILESRKALSRKVINRHLVRLRAVFSWAVEEELIPGTVAAAIREVKGVQPGEKGVKENDPRPPAFWEDVTKVLPHCPPPVAAMLQLQALTGMRSGEVRIMRTMDVDQSNPDCWLYRPGSDRPYGRHKNAWRGQDRVVPFGPRCIEILTPWLRPRESEAYLFSPRRWMEQKSAERIAKRKTKRQPSQALDKRKKANPKRAPRDCYDKVSYPQAVKRACAKVDVRFEPYALRHGKKMDLERSLGSEAARCVLGQKSIDATQHYGTIDVGRAIDAMKKMG